MKFKDILQEIRLETGTVGKVLQDKEVEKPVKKKRGRKVFGLWFKSHGNKKHLE